MRCVVVDVFDDGEESKALMGAKTSRDIDDRSLATRPTKYLQDG